MIRTSTITASALRRSAPFTSSFLASSLSVSSTAALTKLYSTSSMLKSPRSLVLPIRSATASLTKRSYATGAGAIKEINTPEDFQKLVEGDKTVVDFHATWCGPCKVIAPKFAEFSTKYPSAQFVKVDVDEVPEVAGACDVRAMPTFQIFKGGKKVAEVVGANPVKLEVEIQKHA
ncbi:hypothetical protein HDV05_006124 [Chytridiales sp. JEL 0842]|nr:hypothetical protein HDV05_006124 [Chytridiales sp. JEL 0842]